MDVNHLIAENIKKLRKDKNLSQADIAEILDCDTSLYSKIERGEIMITHKKLLMLAEYFNVTIDKFYDGLHYNQTNYSCKQVNCGVQIINNETNELLAKLMVKIDDLLSKR